MSYPAAMNLPTHPRGDRWPGLVIGPILINGGTPSVALSRVRWHFKQGASVYRLDSQSGQRDAPITITNPTTWIATVPPIESGFLPKAGTWDYDIEFYGTGQGAMTFLRGSIIIEPDLTQ